MNKHVKLTHKTVGHFVATLIASTAMGFTGLAHASSANLQLQAESIPAIPQIVNPQGGGWGGDEDYMPEIVNLQGGGWGGDEDYMPEIVNPQGGGWGGDED